MTDPRLDTLARIRSAVQDGSLYELPAGATDRAILDIIATAEAWCEAVLAKDLTISSLRSSIALQAAIIARQGNMIDELKGEAERLHQSVARWWHAQGGIIRPQ